MFQKIRLRLTFLSGGITTLILVIMTLGYLYISEKNLMQNKLLSLQNDISSIAFSLEQQTVITHTWLANLEGRSNYYVSILDNNTPFLFDTKTHGQTRSDLIAAVWAFYRENADDLPESTLSYQTHYKNFSYQSYYCFVLTLNRAGSSLEMLLISPLLSVRQQIVHQRLVFTSIISLALLAIWLFAWFFTGKLLHPIEESRRKQNQFVAAASHELRTPLAVILSCTETALEKLSVEKTTGTSLQQDLSTIRSEALRTSRLLGDMLMLSSHDTGHFDMNCSDTELDTLLLNVYETFENMAAAKQLRLHAVLPEDALPACHCDSERITQVLTILLHNAVSYTPEGGQITLSVSHAADHFRIRVSDTGVGIPDVEKDRIFDRFYRSEKARSDKNHFGLGLSIAHEIITAHHGSITVADTPGGGSTFIITLPEN